MTEETPFEAQLRRMLAEDADGVHPEDAPYDAIVRHARTARRRGMVAAGAGIAVLAVVPGVALGAHGGWGADPALAPMAASPTPTPTSDSPPSEEPEGMRPPASPGQLADGIGMEEASAAFARCLESYLSMEWPEGVSPSERPGGDLEDYRVLQAWKLDANPNEGGPGTGVLAAPREGTGAAYFCRDREETQNLRVLNGDGAPERAVTVDANAAVLYRQITMAGQDWRLPYRWVDFGTVAPGIDRVTVKYGGRTTEAVLDDGYFVASGVLSRQPDEAPAIKGYDADGTLVYDSGEDRYYDGSLG